MIPFGLVESEHLPTKRSVYQDVQTFEYDGVSRLTSASGTGTTGIPAYDYDYTYGPGGNLGTRINRTPNPDLTRTYTYGTVANHHNHAVVSISGDGLTGTFVYDEGLAGNGNMTSRTVNNVIYTQVFDAENRLVKVTKELGVNDLIAEFCYDADGNRILTIYKSGPTESSRVYTPFPEFEKIVPASGATTERSSYTIGGQLIAVRVRVGTSGDGTLRYAYGDHLGSVSAWSDSAGVYLPNSTALFEPYGGFRIQPLATVNPGVSDRGFTGHRMNNTCLLYTSRCV